MARKPKPTDLGSGAAQKAASAAKTRKEQKRSKLDEIFSKMPYHQKKK